MAQKLIYNGATWTAPDGSAATLSRYDENDFGRVLDARGETGRLIQPCPPAVFLEAGDLEILLALQRPLNSQASRLSGVWYRASEASRIRSIAPCA